MSKTHYRVIDAIMGAGKTTYIINELKKADPEKARYIVITPYLPEVKRFIGEVLELSFVEPVKKGNSGKLVHLHTLLEQGCNIVSTHELFKRWSMETLALLEQQDYQLIIDETVDCVRQYGVDEDDIAERSLQTLLSHNLMQIDGDGRLRWAATGEVEEFKQLKHDCDSGRLFKSPSEDGSLTYWEVPIALLKAFSSVTILTYMFDGSLMSAYLESVDIEPERLTLNDGHGLVKWTLEREMEAAKSVASLINVLDDEKLNDIGERHSLSSSSLVVMESGDLEVLKNNIRGALQNRFKAKGKDAMWSCVGKFKDGLTPHGYKGSFVACNIKATNELRHKTALVYIRNIYHLPPITNYFHRAKDIKLDVDRYALSELLQWVFRSAVRDGKPVNLYLPSARMRRLLTDWACVSEALVDKACKEVY